MNVAAEQSLAVLSARLEAAGRMHLHTGKQPVGKEVFISHKLNPYQFVPSAGVDNISDEQCVSRGIRTLLDPDLGIEVAATLKVVQQIAAAFVQQVLVHG